MYDPETDASAALSDRDDIERFEPTQTHIDIGGSDEVHAVVGALCLFAVIAVIVVAVIWKAVAG